jgi:hypothetical protein
VRSRTLLFLPVVALLGAAVVVLPALAASSEVTLQVNENCVEPNWPCWTSSSDSRPAPTSVTRIAAGGTVEFVDETGVAASIAWKQTPGTTPLCSAEVPVSPAPAKAGWHGECKFEQSGTYVFESPTLWHEYTKYEVIVEGAGSSPGTTTTSPATTTGTTTTTATNKSSGSNTSSNPGTSTPASGGSGVPAAGGSSAPAGSLLVGGAASTVELASHQHGHSVRGSLVVAATGAGGHLEVRLLAARASLAAGGSARAQVGRLVRFIPHAGTYRFDVALNARARGALGAHGRLVVSVAIALRGADGATATLTRSVLLRS